MSIIMKTILEDISPVKKKLVIEIEAKEVEKKQKNEVAVFEQMAELQTTGFEGADFESYATPFLRILQQNSPQVLEDTDNYIPDAKPGYFFKTPGRS